jgi:hypothetical protein
VRVHPFSKIPITQGNIVVRDEENSTQAIAD